MTGAGPVVSDVLRDADEVLAPGRTDALTSRSLAELAKAAEAAGPRRWVVESSIVAGQHGILGAVWKAGKGWDAVDLAVSIASGTPWLGRFACPAPGPVLLFVAEEGDEREITRRMQAVGCARGLDYRELPINVALAVPRICDNLDVVAFAREVNYVSPALTIIDPLYRAAVGADARSLIGMGEVLGRLDPITREAGSALVAVHHNNRSRDAKGSASFSGAGAAEWGRFLIASEVTFRGAATDGGSRVVRKVEVTGMSLPDHTFIVERSIRPVVPDDPDCPLVYEVAVRDEAGPDAADELSWPQRRVLAVLGADSAARTIQEIGDLLAADDTGKPLKHATIRVTLNELASKALADREGVGGGANRWWRT
jgi:hypothetical protein